MAAVSAWCGEKGREICNKRGRDTEIVSQEAAVTHLLARLSIGSVIIFEDVCFLCFRRHTYPKIGSQEMFWEAKTATTVIVTLSPLE